MLGTLVFAVLLLGSPACAGQPRPTPARSDAHAAAPILDQYRRVYAALDGIGDSALSPKTEARERDVVLRRHAGVIGELAALTAGEPERIGALDPKHPGEIASQWGRLRRILAGDAGRARDGHDDAAAYARLLALARLGETMARSPLLEAESAGASLDATLKLCAMLGDKDASAPPAEVKALFARWAAFKAEGFARAWAAGAHGRAGAARATYAVPGGPHKLAAVIEEQGVAPGSAAGAAKAASDNLAGRMGDAGLLVKRDAEEVRRMMPERVAGEIAAAEAIIPKIQGVLALNDPSLTLPQIGGALDRAPSQVAKLIVGSPWTEMYLAELRADEAGKVLERIRERFAEADAP